MVKVRLVPVAIPNVGVIKTGEFEKTNNPDPVSSVTADARLELDGEDKNVATLAPNPLIPVETGNPIQLVNVPDVGVPSNGVTNDGEVENTNNPVPVSSVTADNKLELDGVDKNVEILTASPETPVDIGSPVQFVKVPEVGVPKKGVTNVGEVENTKAPVPVSSVIAANKLALLGVVRKVDIPDPSPLTPLLIGRPLQFVSVPLVGVPSNGVIKVGDVEKTNRPVPVSSVTADARFALLGTAKKVDIFVPIPDIPVITGSPVQFVKTPLVGVPSNGATKVGVLDKTTLPVPVLVATPVPPLATAIVVPFQIPVVIVPMLDKLESVVTAVFTNVPVIGSVIFVAPVVVNVNALTPEVVKLEAVLIFPAMVIVFAPLLTPLPPLAPDNVPDHPTVIEAACKSAVVGDPPRVNVTLVSSVFVNAAPVIVA